MSWQACSQMNEGAVMQRGFSGIMTELPELKCLIHITCTKAPQISRHLHQNELKLINLEEAYKSREKVGFYPELLRRHFPLRFFIG